MRRLLILIVLSTMAILSGCASADYQPGIPGVRDVPAEGAYPSRSGTITDWSPSTSR